MRCLRASSHALGNLFPFLPYDAQKSFLYHFPTLPPKICLCSFYVSHSVVKSNTSLNGDMIDIWISDWVKQTPLHNTDRPYPISGCLSDHIQLEVSVKRGCSLMRKEGFCLQTCLQHKITILTLTTPGKLPSELHIFQNILITLGNSLLCVPPFLHPCLLPCLLPLKESSTVKTMAVFKAEPFLIELPAAIYV